MISRWKRAGLGARAGRLREEGFDGLLAPARVRSSGPAVAGALRSPA